MSLAKKVAMLKKLIGNPTVYAVQREDGTYNPVREHLTNRVLWGHVHHKWTVGTYINFGDKARTLVFDIDELDLTQATMVEEALRDLGLPGEGIAIEYSGNKGYHVWVVAAQYLEAHTLRRIGNAVLAMTDLEVEVFPKQDIAKDLGNLVKLPFGLHQKTQNQADFNSSWPRPISRVVFEQVASELPEIRATGGGEAAPPIECMANIQAGVGRGNRNMAMFHFCVMLRRSGASTGIVMAAAEVVNNKFDPSLDPSEVDQIVANSANAGPICSQLPTELRCEECPVYQTKLHTKEGQIRHGASGELAVIEIGRRRKDGSIELVHPDLEAALSKIRR